MHPVDIHHDRITPLYRKIIKRRVLLSTRVAMLLSTVVTATGIWISLNTLDWSWFARSGSLVVIIGIFLTSSQIIENSRKLKNRRAYHDHNFKRDFAEDLKQHTLERSRSLDEDIWASGLRGLYLLVTGTLIWGFGDLVSMFIS